MQELPAHREEVVLPLGLVSSFANKFPATSGQVICGKRARRKIIGCSLI